MNFSLLKFHLLLETRALNIVIDLIG